MTPQPPSSELDEVEAGSGDQIERLARTILEEAGSGDRAIVAVVWPDGDWSVYTPDASAMFIDQAEAGERGEGGTIPVRPTANKDRLAFE